MHASQSLDMRFPAPSCNDATTSETTNTANPSLPWSPLQNSWIVNGENNETTCYDQVRQFFAKLPAISRQSTAFTAIWGKKCKIDILTH